MNICEDRHLSNRRKKSDNRAPLFNRFLPPALILLAGLVLRLVIAPLGGHPGDVPVVTRWAAALNAQGLFAVYQVSDANYPPLAMALIGITARLYHLLTGGAALTINPLWLTLMKLPPILADLGIGWVVWKMNIRERARQTRGLGISPLHRSVLLAMVVFNPALIYLSAYWGQYESVCTLFALLAVLCAIRGKGVWAGAALGAGLMVKLQAAVVGPVVVLAVLAFRGSVQSVALTPHRAHAQARSERFAPLCEGGQTPGSGGGGLRLLDQISPKRIKNLALAALGGLLAILLLMGPYLIGGQGVFVLKRLVAVVSGPGWITVNALNGWYLVTGGAANWAYQAPLVRPDTDPIVWGLSARTIGTALLAVWAVIVVVLAWRARDKARGWLLAATLLYMGVFLFLTQVKERYSFGAVVMLAGAVAIWLVGEGSARHDSPLHQQQTFWLYIVFSALHALNLLWAAPVLGLDEWFAGNSIYGLIIAAGMVISTGWGLWLLITVAPKGPYAYHQALSDT